MINWTEQPLDTQMGRAIAFNDNAPLPLPVAGSVLFTLGATDVHENDFLIPDVNRLYTATFEGNTGRISYNTYTQLMVTAYSALTGRCNCIDYVTLQGVELDVSEFTEANYAPAGTLPELLAKNGRSPR